MSEPLKINVPRDVAFIMGYYIRKYNNKHIVGCYSENIFHYEENEEEENEGN